MRKRYIGFCGDLKKRIKKHNQGSGSLFTKKGRPWKLIYYQVFFLTDIVILYEILAILLLIAAISTVIEGITPMGLDNLSVPLVSASLYWIMMVM